MFVFVIGSPAQGFTFIGPFDTVDDANTWAAQAGFTAGWINEIHDPALITDPQDAAPEGQSQKPAAANPKTTN